MHLHKAANLLTILNIALNPFLDHVDVDSDGEGPPNPKAKAKVSARGSRYTRAEDELLISGWLHTSLDSITGTGQKEEAFWLRVQNFFAENSPPGAKRRGRVPLKSRWSRINLLVSKFVGCYDQQEREYHNGENPDNMMSRALADFQSKEGFPFNLQHCWKILRHEPKWRTHNEPTPQPTPNASGSESRSSKRSRATTEAEDGEEQESPVRPIVRPIGREAAKRNRGKKVSRKIDVGEEAATEEASRNNFNDACDFRIRELELQLANSNNNVLMALLAKETLTPSEEATKEALLKKMYS